MTERELARVRIELGIVEGMCDCCKWYIRKDCEHPLYQENDGRPCEPKDNWQDWEPVDG